MSDKESAALILSSDVLNFNPGDIVRGRAIYFYGDLVGFSTHCGTGLGPQWSEVFSATAFIGGRPHHTPVVRSPTRWRLLTPLELLALEAE